MALAEVELVPFLYEVEEASLMVTFWPADVVSVKPDVDTLPTVPVDPPVAGPERELEPAPPLPGMPCPAAAGAVAEGDVAVADGVVAVADGVVAAQPESPITAPSAAAAIHPLLPFHSNRRTLGRRVSRGPVGS
jgi:hypothetical protein